MKTAERPPTADRAELDELSKRVAALENRFETAPDSDSLSMVVFSGELDRVLAALVIATGAAACGMTVSMFFTFWGTAALKKAGPQAAGKTLIERMFGWMLPGGFHKLKLSKMDMMGIGRRMMAAEMRKKQTPDLSTLIDIARESDVEINICDMSMSLMGIRKEELIEYPGLSFCGVARFLELSSKASTTLFI